MCATSSEVMGSAFARAAARAIYEELSQAKWAENRFFLRELFGLDPKVVFRALTSELPRVELDVKGVGKTVMALASSDDKSATVVLPYLIGEDDAIAEDIPNNIGEDGFAARLRTHFTVEAEQPRVLIVLGKDLPETIVEPSKDAAELPVLSFSSLCHLAALPAAGAPQPAPLIRSIAMDYIDRCKKIRPDWRNVERLHSWVVQHWDDPNETVARSIHELGLYISATDLKADNPGRQLTLAAVWRERLASWSNSPGVDLARKLAKSKVGGNGIRAVLAANSVRGLDYSRIYLTDLQDRGSLTPLELETVSPVDGSELVALQSDGALVVWMPASGGELRFRLNRSPSAHDAIRIFWETGPSVVLQVRGSSAIASVAPPDTGLWRFGRLLVESAGGTETAEYAIALTFDDRTVAAFETAMEIDPGAGAFVCGENPSLTVWDRTGRQLGAAQLYDQGDQDDDSLVQDLTGVYGELQVGPVPVIPSRSRNDIDDEPGLEGEDRSDDSSQGEESSDSDDDDLSLGTATGRGEYPSASPEQPTFAHAMLAYRQARWPDTPSTPSAGEISARFDSVKLSINPRIGKIDLLPAEQQILLHPEWLAYSIESDGAVCRALRGFPTPEASWSEEMNTFRHARERYFAAAREAGSTYALDPRDDTAVDYVGAYRSLLEALPSSGASRAEYDDLLSVDRVVIGGISGAFIGPTAPLTVAWHRSLTERFCSLAASHAQVDRADLASFNPTNLIPFLSFEDQAHEVYEQTDALLWRHYLPLSKNSEGSQSRNARFIAGRIAFFLSVHPSLDKPENTLAVTFSNPGDAAIAVDALRAFFRKERGSSNYLRPRIRAIFRGANDDVGQTIDRLRAGAIDNDLDRIVTTRADFILSNDAEPDGFSSIAFLFRSPGKRPVRPVRLDQRAPTAYAESLASAPGRVLLHDLDYVYANGTFCAQPGAYASDLEAIQFRSLELVGGQGGDVLIPGWTRMITATASEKALANWYDAAAWVVHLDRLVGLEAFADPSAERTILEYEEGADPATFGYDGITGTRHIQPYLRAMLKAFEGFAQPDPEAAHALMRKLEAVSGRWALQLVQSSLTKVFERAGTACAVRYLADVENALRGDAGVLNALVSLEEILPGFPATGVPRRLVASRAGRGPMCDDLLLVSVQSRESISPVVQATVVEVKFWNAEAADYSTAGEQVEETIGWLDTRFNVDPAVKDLRGRDLAELIRSSCSRNSAFGLSPALSAHSESVLAEISQGRYELRFGHWRDGAYRRGLIAAVEPARAGGFELSQLNGPNGPIDLVSIRQDLVRQAIEMKPLNTPEGWAVLRMSAPPDESSALADVSPPPDPDTDESGKAEATSSISESTGSVCDASEADETGVRRRERQAPIEEISADANRLNDAFAKYGLSIEPFQPDEAQVGPSVIRFRTRTLGRLSIADIERRSRDISREVGAPGEITIGDEPGKITVDVPRLDRQPVPLRDALNALDEYERQPGALAFVAGVAPNGEVRIADLSRLPHLLVAGATGSGKSVFLRSLLIELFRSRTPQQLRVMIIDPKRLDFSPLNSSPYLEGGKVISDPDHALELLRETLEREINARQVILEGAGVSSAAEFYEQGGALEALPQFVILVDEFADLVLAGTDRRGFSEMVQRYAQIARAFGIFLVLATQRPSVDVITGSIKANLTARIAFSLPSGRDSMTILDRTGAEDLLGDGDLLFYYNGRVDRLQSPFATLEDLRAVLR